MVKSAASQIVRDSAKVDLHEWLAGGKPRTKPVYITNDPNLIDELDDLAARIDALADKLDAAEESGSGGIADDDPIEAVRAEHAALLERHAALSEEYEASLLTFTFRAQKPTDLDEVRAALKDAKVGATNANMGMALVAHLCVEPVMSFKDLQDALQVLGDAAFIQMSDAVTELARKRKEPTAPLSLRP